MSLPIAWVEKIFRKLTLVYGRDFTARWEGLKSEDVIDDWAEELSGFANWPEAISWALQNMPEGKPPTVIEFRAICLKAPKPNRPALPEPKADPERVATAMAKLSAPAPSLNIHTDWIRRGLTDLAAGIKKTPAVEKMIRQAAQANGIRHA